MSLGGVLVLPSSNKDKQAGITVVVQEKRQERREEKVGREVQESLK